MAAPNPTNSNLNNRHEPPSTPSHSRVPFTPRSVSIADDSDTEFDPTPIHSPGGPQYDDLPPSYDEAREQAVHDVRNGITPLDPSQLEAHRLTLDEGPNEPEIWEYRVRGEQLEDAQEHEQAPDYETHTSGLASTVPVQHVVASENIPVGRIGGRSASSAAAPSPFSAMLNQALEFARHEPDAHVQNAPGLTRCIAIPQQGLPERPGGRSRRNTLRKDPARGSRDDQRPPGYSTATSEPLPADSSSSDASIQFLRAYAKALHGHSVRPGEFTEFLDGLNALCTATDATTENVLHGSSPIHTSSGIVSDYIQGANEAFFAPRGLRVSLRPLSALLDVLSIPTQRDLRAVAVARVLDPGVTAGMRAQALHPWIEALDTNVPSPNSRTLLLREMGNRSRNQDDYAEPPHSIPEPLRGPVVNRGPHGRGRRGNRGRGGNYGSPWSPVDAPGYGPFGAPGSGPSGHNHGRAGNRGAGPGSSQPTNEWAALGNNLGKWGEGFGKRMGEWGGQFGKRAGAWGQDVGRRAGGCSEEASARASGSVSQMRGDDDLPPSYNEGLVGQEKGPLHGDLHGDSKAAVNVPTSVQSKGNKVTKSKGYDDDDTSSSSSDSSDSDSGSDSDSDDSDYPDTEAIFLKRIRSINERADLTAKKGKKSAEEIAHERAEAIEQAHVEKAAMEADFEGKLSLRATRRELRRKRRELERQHRQRKREIRVAHTAKGKGKAKKTTEWREAKQEYRTKKKALRKEKQNSGKEWRNAKKERRKMRREITFSTGHQEDATNRMVWIVVEDLGP